MSTLPKKSMFLNPKSEFDAFGLLGVSGNLEEGIKMRKSLK